MKKIIFLLLITFLASGNIYSQEPLTPVQIAEKYYSDDTTGIYLYFCCEMLQKHEPPTPEEERARDSLRLAWGLPEIKNPVVAAELVQQSDSFAVVSLNLSEDTLSQDLYLYFVNNEGWKLETTRALAFGAFTYMFIKLMENITDEERPQYEKMGMLKDLQFNLDNARLLLKDDKNLILHFQNRRERFIELLREVKNTLTGPGFYSCKNSDSLPAVTRLGKQLLITSITRYGSGNIQFVIGGMLDNTAGYLYCENPAMLPQITPGGYIIIKEIGGGWYLFKTT